MPTGLEIAVVIIVLAALVGVYTLMKVIKPLAVNTVVGLVIFLLAEAVLGIGVSVTPLALAVVALGGVPGALVVLLLAVLDVAFVPGLIIVP